MQVFNISVCMCFLIKFHIHRQICACIHFYAFMLNSPNHVHANTDAYNFICIFNIPIIFGKNKKSLL